MRGTVEARLGKQALCHARHAAGVVVGKQDRVHTPISRDESYTASMRTSLNELEHTHASTRSLIRGLKLIIGDVEQKQKIYDSSVSTAKCTGIQSVKNTCTHTLTKHSV